MATWANTELCKVSDVQGYFRDLSYLLATETSDSTVTNQIQTKIDLVKRDVIRPEVLLLARASFPATVTNLKRLGRARYRQWLAHKEADDQIAGKGSLQKADDQTGYELWFNESSSTIKPRVWYSAGTPGVSTNTSAVNGDFCIDSTNELMYINRATSGAPDWQRWTADSAHDYIYNPGELKRWACLEVVRLCLVDREFRNFATSQDDVALERMQGKVTGLIYGQLDSYGKPVESIPGAKKTALAMLRFDISDDGVLSDYEDEVSTEPYIPFA